MELFQVARKKTMTERTCRGAFRKTGIYPFNPKAVLDEIPLKEIEKGRLTEPSDGDTTSTPKQKRKAPAPIDTPHNTAAVQSHVVAVLDELDSLAVQGIYSDHHDEHIFNCMIGIPIGTPTRNRVLQLGKSARMTMAREAIQLETNRQLRQNNRNLNRKAGPGPRTALADKETRVLTTEVAEDLKKKAEAKFEAELEAKLRLEKKREEKAFHDAMIASPLGGLYEAASVAEHGETEITIDVSLRWRVEAIKVNSFVTPTVEFRLEDHEAGPMPRLVKDRKARGLAPPSKASGTWKWIPAEEEKDWSFVHISFP